MRAGRLLAMLLALQRVGRMTAGQLADELEVSARTVLRDVEALSEAGVPIYTVQGHGGGIQLVDGFQGRLAALTADDAPGLLLAGTPALAASLGLEPAAQAARDKLLGALPPTLATAALDVDRWFRHEVTHDPPAEVVRAVAAALRAGWSVTLHRPGGCDVVAPLGLVLAEGDWHLVHLAHDGPRAAPLAGAVGADLVARPVARPDGFDLATTWRRLSAHQPVIP